MNSIGDFEETSRAVPADIDLDSEHIRLISEITKEGEDLKNSAERGVYTICCFNGSASQSLAEAYVASLGEKAVLISRAFLRHDSDTNPENAGPAKRNLFKRLALTIYKVNNILLVVSDQEQFGSSFSNQLLDSELHPWIELSRLVYIFHADSISNFKSHMPKESLYYVKSGAFGEKDLSEIRKLSTIKPLPMPNLIENFSAAILIHCEMTNKPCLIIVNYTEFSDTLSHLPFLRFIQSASGLQDLPKLSSDIALRTKTNNSILYNSNLFI